MRKPDWQREPDFRMTVEVTLCTTSQNPLATPISTGSYTQIAGKLNQLLWQGCDTLILDGPTCESEMIHIAQEIRMMLAIA